MVVIIPITSEILGDCIAMVQEINEEKLSSEQRSLIKDDFDHGLFHGFILYKDEQPIGAAILYEGYSTLRLKKTLTLEELHITEKHRGKGLGKELMDHVVQYARTNGYARLEWRTRHDNHHAQKLYSKYKTTDGWLSYVVPFN